MPELKRFERQFAAGLAATVPRPAPMMIYRNTVVLGAVEALAGNFPVTRDIVGSHAFEALAVAHAHAFPPVSPVLALYGQKFPAWLEREAIAHELPYLADVARCEWMRTEAMNAEDAPALDIETIERVCPDRLLQLQLKLHPAMRFAWHGTPAIEIWLAHQQAEPAEIAPDWRACGALFTRPEFAVDASTLDACAYRLLCGILFGESLGEAAMVATTRNPGTDLGTCFAQLVQHGAFAAISLERT